MASFMLILGITAISMFFITQPLFVKKYPLPKESKASGDTYHRQETMMALNELEYDYRMNKLTKEDYEAMAFPLRKLAAAWMAGDQQAKEHLRKTNDQLRKEVEDEIEQALQKKVKGMDRV